MKTISISVAAALLLALGNAAPTGPASSGSSTGSKLPGLDKIKHVVYFMQENRSFDMYYGTMAGVRGFQDPNIGIQDNGLNLLYQPDSKSPDKKNGTSYLLPYHFQGNRAGCTPGGSNMWAPNHRAWNDGKYNNWPDGNAPASMGYLTRDQIPFHYALAESFTICDMYFQSIIGSTDPNRVVWMSGTNQGPPNNYVLEDNTESISLGWETYPQNLTKANITWQVFQDKDNFDDNALAWFAYWRDLKNGPEKQKGVGFVGLQDFYDRAAKGTLPQFSIIVGPTELSEHPSNTPQAGAWLQQQVVNAVMHSPKWNETALFINYDESGGYFDHVVPPTQPKELWVKDKFTGQMAPDGLGPRVPMVIVSPWTRGGHVFSEVSDHTSTLRFMEEWVGKSTDGKYLAPAGLVDDWHRKTTSNLVNVFDFDNPDYSIPELPKTTMPTKNIFGMWDPTEMCEKLSDPKTKPPYGNQTYPTVEKGSKLIRGALTEGRALAMVSHTGSLMRISTGGEKIELQKLTKRGTSEFGRSDLFYLEPVGALQEYMIRSLANPEKCLDVWGTEPLISECKGTSWVFEYHANDAHHHVRHKGTDMYLGANDEAKIHLSKEKHPSHFKIYSVTY
ncbi:hypothetical protein EC973_005580 [Apophysomyces ossiformis]|uniref:Non-hemolytic phospholipase C n=1 Tax=Apophysomyces ossiformis TaxID=679940 RepID=A0A8H7ESS3_9FUNG|nr:hypothetical protein EC973_005580 [Apophysomyces ossiformis]